MKKLTALILSLLMLIPMLSLGISATSIDDKLVAHYDFEGSTREEACTNKANGGTTTGTGKINDANASAQVTVENGLLLSAPGGRAAKISKDFIGAYVSGSVEFTAVIRLKMDSSVAAAGSAWIQYPLINMKTNAAPTIVANFTDNKSGSGDFFQVYINNVQHRFFGITFEELQADFVNAAIVVYKDASGNLYAKMYASKGTPTEADQWIVLNETIQKGASLGTAIPSPGIDMFFFDKGLSGVILDDFRMYSDDLTVDELQSIFAVKEEPVSELVKNFGAQNKFDDLNNDGTNDAFSVRFVGGIDSENYDSVGIEIITTVGEKTAQTPHTETSQTVYTSVIENGETVLATTKGSAYFIAFIIPDIPLDLELGDGEYISFKYRFFAENGNTTLYSEYITVTYTADGVPVI